MRSHLERPTWRALPWQAWLRPLRLAWTPKQLLAGGTAILTLGLCLDSKVFSAASQSSIADRCVQVVESKAQISRQQLGQFLTIPEATARPQVTKVLPKPYCYLASLQIRTGSKADRAVYPLASNPKTWLVVLYEGDRYMGYDFITH
ncbi:hypothetical protein [Alkalinema sp. FACHB-956]|uniref:hypothetical protein n=1 Tax=Alkalinema sp. FACHB-956 TaxID=2692768 RepID=UPI0016857335|nr:hypothetical protein [Alkalinema sp. FACHB-956]MBD2327723.1 hypothetical protein [Alkalinema sp. FACHB-956]